MKRTKREKTVKENIALRRVERLKELKESKKSRRKVNKRIEPIKSVYPNKIDYQVTIMESLSADFNPLVLCVRSRLFVILIDVIR